MYKNKQTILHEIWSNTNHLRLQMSIEFPKLCPPHCSCIRRNSESGSSLVEFAIILPLLFLLLFGIIEFGIFMHDRAILINASREGARAGVLYGSNFTVNNGEYSFGYADENYISDVIKSYCENHLVSFNPGANDLQIHSLVYPDGKISGGKLIVKVTYDFKFLVFSNLMELLGSSFANPITLEAETIMRLE